MGNIQCCPLGFRPRGLSAMAKPRWSVTHPEEALEAGGTTTASATRATRSRVATMNKRSNNPLAISVVQGIKSKIHSRLTSNQSESPSTTINRTRTSGFDAAPLPLKFQGDPTPQNLSTFRWPWSPHPSRDSWATLSICSCNL
jgi:hypothetical protein